MGLLLELVWACVLVCMQSTFFLADESREDPRVLSGGESGRGHYPGKTCHSLKAPGFINP